ncbi:helix-turn-helix domain-containing protein [Cryobacterium sp. TMT1-2-2]|nr:helix-turn-helix domain-containing protein [Cryobacterium sp. TMT1-2-2]TFD10282.1 helix-turn-helix domain-containing protein [Cryobacterium sp. TMT1-66-1]
MWPLRDVGCCSGEHVHDHALAGLWMIIHNGSCGRSTTVEAEMYTRSAQDLGALARAKREALGLTQQQVADRAKVSREWLVNFESAKVGVSLFRVFDVLQVLQLALDVSDRAPDPHNVLDDVFADLGR